MIVPKEAHLGRMLQYVGTPLLYLLLWDVLVVFAFKVLGWEWVAISSTPLALFGSVIGLVVGFRNNYAYSRWWEARSLWGQIVNNSRSLARQVCACLISYPSTTPEDGAEIEILRRRVVHLQVAFVHSLRQQLRGLDPFTEIGGLLTEEDISALKREKNVAVALQFGMGQLLRDARHRSWIDTWEWQSMDRNLDDLADSQGGAERIKNTPMPRQYSFFPTLFVRIYCLVLPIGLVENLGWYTPIGSTLVGFMFLALDKIGRDLENPFDNKIYDVPLTAITKTIEINLRQMLGEDNLPDAEVPIKGVLW